MSWEPVKVDFRDCILHDKTGHNGGYAMSYWDEHKYTGPLHRIEYCKHHGLSPKDIKGKVVMHLCDNPRCIFVGHLHLGTYKENSQDMVKKGRHNRKIKVANPLIELYKEWEKYDDKDYVN